MGWCVLVQVLRPSCHIQNLHFWDAVYLSETAPAVASGVSSEQFEAAGSDVSSSSAVTSPDQQISCLPAKTRSCDDLPKAGLDDDDDIVPMMSAQRRLSDPNIAAHSAAGAAASETRDEDDDDVCDVRTAVSCEQSDHVIVSDDPDRNSANDSELTDVAATSTVSLVAVSSLKCASNETLKAVEEVGGDLRLSDYRLDSVLKQTGVSDASSPAVLAMFQASSDTLTGEDGHPPAVLVAESSTASPSGDTDCVNIPTNDEELLLNGVGIHSQVLKMKTMLDRCSSTSDISSSHVVDGPGVMVNGGMRTAIVPLTVDTKLALTAACGSSTPGKGVNGDCDGPGVSQPPSCSSTSPPTPNSDGKVRAVLLCSHHTYLY